MLTIITFLLIIPPSELNVITTVQGKLRGVVHDGYVSYSGIPYGTVLSSERRFRTAGLAPIWHAIRGSKEFQCHQNSNMNNCLTLDVHVPNGPSPNLPVLVWITGGGSNFGPGMLVNQGIIVVTIHHRIGPLGFLCLSKQNIPGNAGVKDVVIALRWVRDNIVAFRGTPAKVTIAGQGMGAAMAEAIMLSPMSEGLYHGVILQSGSILCPWAFNYDAEERAKVFANMFNEDNISKVRTEELADKSNKLDVPYFPFGMCVENKFKSEERFLYEAPYDLMTDKKVHSVPIIIGYNSEEAYIFASILKDSGVMSKAFKDTSILLPYELKFLNDRETKQVAMLIEDMYFNNKSMSALLKYYTDAYFTNHIHRSTQLHAATSHHPVYFYQFSYLGDAGVRQESGVKKTGAAHSDELAYLFHSSSRNLKAEDEVLQRKLIKLWTNFVKYLNPTPKQNSFHWEPVNTDNPRLLDISTDLKMMDYPNEKAQEIWNDIYVKYYYTRNSGSGN